MTPTLVSLLAITLGFSGLILWVFWPSRREHLEALGQIPLDEIPLGTQKAQATLDTCEQLPELNR